MNLATEAAIRDARVAEHEGGCITYLIRDPRKDDLKGNPGWPFYVGQTKGFGKRVYNHLRKSEKLATVHDSVKRRIKEILHAGRVPIFEVLDRQPTRLLSLVSETNFARACRRRGYDIANLRRLQNVAGPPITVDDIPREWLWEFRLEEGIADRLSARIRCRHCHDSLSIGLSHFASVAEPPATLRGIRDHPVWMIEPCTLCGRRGGRAVELLVPSQLPAMHVSGWLSDGPASA